MANPHPCLTRQTSAPLVKDLFTQDHIKYLSTPYQDRPNSCSYVDIDDSWPGYEGNESYHSEVLSRRGDYISPAEAAFLLASPQ